MGQGGRQNDFSDLRGAIQAQDAVDVDRRDAGRHFNDWPEPGQADDVKKNARFIAHWAPLAVGIEALAWHPLAVRHGS